jgi:hypothetical protein
MVNCSIIGILLHWQYLVHLEFHFFCLDKGDTIDGAKRGPKLQIKIKRQRSPLRGQYINSKEGRKPVLISYKHHRVALEAVKGKGVVFFAKAAKNLHPPRQRPARPLTASIFAVRLSCRQRES